MPRAVASCSPAIQFTDVDLRFLAPNGKAFPALHNFNFRVEAGEFIALVGPTGCGKSTTLNLITGSIQPDRGHVLLNGQPVSGIDPGIGFVFQADALFPWRTVLDNVAMGPLYRGVARPAARQQARHWLSRVGLDKFAGHYPHQLSGGMRKRVALAQTFINGPEILLMDEPFSALDVQTRVLMQDRLLQLWSDTGASVVFVTHDLEEAIALADKVYVLTAGPATVKTIYTVDLPRPRITSDIRYDPTFIELSRRIWDDLRDEVRIGQSRAEGA
jgi:NitT/TauT family transport system ATP-binding protein